MTHDASVDIGPPGSDVEIRAFVETIANALFFPRRGADLETWTTREGRENIRVARQDGQVIGGLIVQRMGQWFGGNSVPTGCVRAVGVAPQHRAAGVASRLMRTALEELQRDGVPLSALYPATQPVYRRAGYEQAGMRLTYSLPTRGIDLRYRSLEVRAIEPSDHDAIRQVYAERAARTLGNLDRNSWLWQRIFESTPWGKPAHGFLVTRDERIEGYLVYTQQEGDILEHANALDLIDLVVLTPDAGRRLLAFLSDHRSMVGKVTFQAGPTDPVLLLLAEQEWSIARRIDWMLRIVDVRGALAARGYPAGIRAELHLDVKDDVLAQNARQLVLAVDDGQGQVRDGGRGRVTIDVRGLAALFTGHVSPFDLRAAGYVDAPDGDLETAGLIFGGPAPWMPDIF